MSRLLRVGPRPGRGNPVGGPNAAFGSLFGYGAVEGWNDGGAGIPASATDIPTGTLVCFGTPVPEDFINAGGGAATLSITMSVIGQGAVASNVDSVVAPTYYRVRSQDESTVLQATAAAVVLNDTAVQIGDVLSASLTFTP